MHNATHVTQGIVSCLLARVYEEFFMDSGISPAETFPSVKTIMTVRFTYASRYIYFNLSFLVEGHLTFSTLPYTILQGAGDLAVA